MQPQMLKRALQKTLLPDLTRATLRDLGTDVIRDTLAIIQHGKQRLSTTQLPQAISPTQASVHLQNFVKAPAAQLTYVLAEITFHNLGNFKWTGIYLNILLISQDSKSMISYIVVVTHMSKIV